MQPKEENTLKKNPTELESNVLEEELSPTPSPQPLPELKLQDMVPASNIINPKVKGDVYEEESSSTLPIQPSSKLNKIPSPAPIDLELTSKFEGLKFQNIPGPAPHPTFILSKKLNMNLPQQYKDKEGTDSQSKFQIAQTGTYLVANIKTLIRIINDVVKFIGLSSDGIFDENSADIRGAQHALHTTFSFVQAWYTDGTQYVMPLINTAIFNIRVYTGLFESDNEAVQCVIDIVSSGVSHLVMFNPLNAGISAGLIGTKCAIRIFFDADNIKTAFVFDIANEANNFVSAYKLVSTSEFMSAYKNIVQMLEGLKAIYTIYDYGELVGKNSQVMSHDEDKLVGDVVNANATDYNESLPGDVGDVNPPDHVDL